MNKHRRLKITITILSILLGLCVACIFVLWSRKGVVSTEIEREVEIVYDTIPLYYKYPIPVDSTVIRYEEVKLPIVSNETQSSNHVKEKIVNTTDTVFVTQIDSVKVQIPISQKIYKDSTYTAWVSGYKQSLDSIQILQPIKTITVTESTIKYKTKRWGVGVQAGVGVTPEKIQPYIGVGVTYNIFSW